MVVCVECLPADKPWDRSVCDTPELWRGAAGLCARVRTCCWCRRIFTYIHTHNSYTTSRHRVAGGLPVQPLAHRRLK